MSNKDIVKLWYLAEYIDNGEGNFFEIFSALACEFLYDGYMREEILFIISD